MIKFLLVFLGGGIGSMLRYGISRVMAVGATGFPWPTFMANLAGCLLAGISMGWLLRQENMNEDHRLLLVVGVCGGFTTFSAFALESAQLLKDNRLATFFIYVMASVIACILATTIGFRLLK